MTPSEYQALAARTECVQENSLKRMRGYVLPESNPVENHAGFLIPIRLNHAAIGLAGEAGELCSLIQKWIYYGKFTDDVKTSGHNLPKSVRDNVAEEIGDVMWYAALACNAAGLDLGEIMEANIRKLKQRYPDKYTDQHAAEENRDRVKEMDAVTKTVPVYDQRGGKNELAGKAELHADGTGTMLVGTTTLKEIGGTLGERFLSFEACDVPPKGWKCTRPKGHEGPCAAVMDNTIRDDKCCQYCARPAKAMITWFKGAFGKPGPVYVHYCGLCSIKDALAGRGMTAPVVEGTDYRIDRVVGETIEQDGHGFGHAPEVGGEG